MIAAASLRRLERLNILARSAMRGGSVGRRPSSRAGSSQEFREYRHYASGDELRYLDWNIYARHGSLFVKEFAAEENVHVAVALDTSASMGVGTPPKVEAVQSLGLALAYVGLCNFDSVGLFAFDDRLRALRDFSSGKGHVHEFVCAAQGIRAEGRTDMAAAFEPALPALKGRTVAILVSDFLDLEGAPQAVMRLVSRRIQVHMIQVLAPDELNPRERGRLVLRDAETGRERELYLSGAAVRRYRAKLGAYLDDLAAFARKREIRIARVLSSDSLESMVVAAARAGILERA